MRRTSFHYLMLIFVFVGIVVLGGCGAPINVPPDPRNGFLDAFFVYPVYLLLDWFASLLWGSYGLSILAVTVVVRIVLLPFAIKQYQSMLRQQEFQPELQKIQEKYRKEPEKLRQELMKFYAEKNINPAMGCLPLLLQFPVIIGLYDAIRRSPHIQEASFLWFPMGTPDPLYILPILAGLATLAASELQFRYTQRVSPVKMPKEQIAMQRGMLYLSPVMVFFFALSLSSAVSLYWVMTNFFSLVQTYFIYELIFLRKRHEKAQMENGGERRA